MSIKSKVVTRWHYWYSSNTFYRWVDQGWESGISKNTASKEAIFTRGKFRTHGIFWFQCNYFLLKLSRRQKRTDLGYKMLPWRKPVRRMAKCSRCLGAVYPFASDWAAFWGPLGWWLFPRVASQIGVERQALLLGRPLAQCDWQAVWVWAWVQSYMDTISFNFQRIPAK